MPDAQAHFIVLCVGTTGDIHPFMRIANTLVSMGHRVTFITNTHHTPLLSRSGLDVVGLGTDDEYRRMIQDPDIWHPQKAFGALLANYKDLLLQANAALQSAAHAGPATVIAHPITVPGAAIAKARGFVGKIVCMYLAPSTLRTCHDPLRIGDLVVPRWVPMSWRRALWRFVEKGWIDPVGMAQVNAARSAMKLPAVNLTLLGHIEDEPDLTVTLFPAWFGPAMPDWPRPLLSGDFQLFDAATSDQFSSELSAFLAAGDRPLVFTPGTGNIHAAAFFSHALAAATRLGLRAVFLTREREQVPKHLPDTVLWQPYVALSGLLPLAKAIIHHGGIGTTAEALRAGAPQLITPFAWDQFDNGMRVAELGVGAWMPAAKLNPSRLSRAIRALVDSEGTRSSCAQIAGRFAQQQDPAELCAEIERLVSRPQAIVPGA